MPRTKTTTQNPPYTHLVLSFGRPPSKFVVQWEKNDKRDNIQQINIGLLLAI